MNCKRVGETIVFEENGMQVRMNKAKELVGDSSLALKVDTLFPFELSYQGKILKKEIPEHFHSYEEVAAFIASQKDRVYALDNFKRFMNDHGTLQDALRCIHVCGTNGKGSTSNFIRDSLEKNGYEVGLFTSPAILTRLEIIQTKHSIADDLRIVKYCNYYMEEFLKYEISLFEIEMFLSILYFIDDFVDYCVYEVGLGGELDATNIIYPLICVNTNISYDHMNYLGNTLEDIASAKAGIIKEGVPFVTGETKENCIAVFAKKCEEKHSELLFVQEKRNISGTSYDYRDYHLDLEMQAAYQVDNSALALETLYQLRTRGLIELDDSKIAEAINTSHWAGRFETLCEDPLIIVDGAHNEDGMHRFYESAKKFSNPLIIFSALRDKDTTSMIEYLLRLSRDVTVTQFVHVRAATAVELAKDYPVRIVEDYKEAIDSAIIRAKEEKRPLLITGSLYFISKVRSYILEKEKV